MEINNYLIQKGPFTKNNDNETILSSIIHTKTDYTWQSINYQKFPKDETLHFIKTY